jgi:hypothetical protein
MERMLFDNRGAIPQALNTVEQFAPPEYWEISPMLYYPLRSDGYFKENPEIAARTARSLKTLRDWIPRGDGGGVPRKDLGKTLLLATWNIRDFGRSGGRGYG